MSPIERYAVSPFTHLLALPRLGISTRYYRVSRLLDELTLARGDGSYPKLIQRLARTWLLILDDWGLASLSGQLDLGKDRSDGDRAR